MSGGLGSIAAPGAFISIANPLTGSGELTLQGQAAQVALASSVAASQTIDILSGVNNQLSIALPQFFGGTIDGFTPGNSIDLGVGATGLGYASNVLALKSDAGQTIDLTIVGSYSFADFSVVDHSSSTAITVSCFAAGTRIRTQRGDIPVEALQVGDIVDTRFVGPVPIKWIGHREVDCVAHPRPRSVWPVRIHADAFGPDQPCRDLWLSPDHAVFVGEVLVPIKRLINGTSVTQVPMDEITYYHIELERHDVLLAEGFPAESYLDTGDRANFADSDGSTTLFPDFCVRKWEAMGCAPLIVTGPEVDAARMLINSRMSTVAQTTHAA